MDTIYDEIRQLSDEELNDYIDTFQNRVEFTKEYISECDDYDVRDVMRGKLGEYSQTLRLLQEEFNRRKSGYINAAYPNGHPARPTGVKITREIQVKTYKAYFACPDYIEKSSILENPIDRREIAENPFTRKYVLCKEDCIFPTCPFYETWSIMNRCKFHKDDYDEWVVKGYEERFK